MGLLIHQELNLFYIIVLIVSNIVFATTDQPTVSDVVVLQWAWRLYATDINDKCNALITSIKKQNRMCKIKNLPIIVYTLQNLNVVMCDPSTE